MMDSSLPSATGELAPNSQQLVFILHYAKLKLFPR
jgi:hypothetical protein